MIIEVCVRSMDHHYIGQTMLPKYHACIQGEHGYWGCGRYPQEAIDSVKRSHPERFTGPYTVVFIEGLQPR